MPVRTAAGREAEPLADERGGRRVGGGAVVDHRRRDLAQLAGAGGRDGAGDLDAAGGRLEVPGERRDHAAPGVGGHRPRWSCRRAPRAR